MQYLGKESAGNRWWSNYRFWDPITRCLASRMEWETYSRQEGISHVDEEKYRQVWVAGGEGRISRLKDTDIKCRRSQPYLKAFCMGLSKPLPQTLSWNLLLLSLTRTCVTPKLPGLSNNSISSNKRCILPNTFASLFIHFCSYHHEFFSSSHRLLFSSKSQGTKKWW